MRQTQWVGLTSDAAKYVKDATPIPSDNKTFGMFYEELPLCKWEKNGYLLVEEVQFSPWSSGPMIFTHLKVFLIKNADQEPVKIGYFFSWVVDPMITCEFDSEKGHMYV